MYKIQSTPSGVLFIGPGLRDGFSNEVQAIDLLDKSQSEKIARMLELAFEAGRRAMQAEVRELIGIR